MNSKYFGQSLSIGAAILITTLYITLKLLLAFGLFDTIEITFEDPFLQLEVGELVSTVVVLIILLVIFQKGIFSYDVVKISFPRLYFLALTILAVIGLRLFEDPFFRYENILFGKPNPDISSLQPIEFSIDIFLKMIRILILQSIFEELLFRKMLFHGLLMKYQNLWTAILVSSILFSITHLSIRNAIPTLAFGMISAYIYYHSKNIWYSITFHILSNLIWFIIYMNPDGYWIVLDYLNFKVRYWVLFVAGVGILGYSLSRIASYKS